MQTRNRDIASREKRELIVVTTTKLSVTGVQRIHKLRVTLSAFDAYQSSKPPRIPRIDFARSMFFSRGQRHEIVISRQRNAMRNNIKKKQHNSYKYSYHYMSRESRKFIMHLFLNNITKLLHWERARNNRAYENNKHNATECIMFIHMPGIVNKCKCRKFMSRDGITRIQHPGIIISMVRR